MYTAGTCATGLGAFYPGARLLYVLFLGEATPLGGVLTLSTCGHSANNTVLYVGTGCPTWALPFACKMGNDNAAGTATCRGNPFASSVSIVATQLTYYVQLGGLNGAHVMSGLSWSYAGVSSWSSSESRSRSRSQSGRRSGSRSGSRSRSRKAK